MARASRQVQQEGWTELPPYAAYRVVQTCTHTELLLKGEIDLANAGGLRHLLLGLLPDDDRPLLLDLSGLEFLDCAGIGVLVTASKQAHREHRRLCIVAASRRVSRVLRLTGADRAVPVTASGCG